MSDSEHSEAGWNRIATRDDIPIGEAREFICQGRILAVYNVDGKFRVLDGVCPHQGGPLGKGTLDGSTVTCPWHGWQFDVTDGKCQLSAAIVQPSYETKLEGDDIFVRWPDD